MKTRLFNAAAVLTMSLAFALLLVVAVQRAESGIPSPSSTLPASDLTSTPPSTSQGPQDESFVNRQTVLLWPKKLSLFAKEYGSWEMWLGGRSVSPYSLRDELLVSVRAIATTIPAVDVRTDEPQSDIIVVSGNSAAGFAEIH